MPNVGLLARLATVDRPPEPRPTLTTSAIMVGAAVEAFGCPAARGQPQRPERPLRRLRPMPVRAWVGALCLQLQTMTVGSARAGMP